MAEDMTEINWKLTKIPTNLQPKIGQNLAQNWLKLKLKLTKISKKNTTINKEKMTKIDCENDQN